MDESWRMRMGMPTRTTVKPNLPRRKSTEDTSNRRRPISGESSEPPLEPEDFSDVFGGPPRTILSHQFSDSAGFSRSSLMSSFYGEILPQPENVEPTLGMSPRNLPEFRIPVRQQRSDHNQNHHNAFYNDIFSWEDGSLVNSRSRSKSKTSSSSALSSEEFSPLRADITGHGMDDVSFFSSKLRPINVRSRWTSTRMGHEDYQRQQITPPFSENRAMFNTENDYVDNMRNYTSEFSRRNPSPETLEPIWDGSMRVSADDLELKSPSSVVSSVCQLDQQNTACEIEDEILQQENDTELEEDEIMSSYVIEINTENREGKCEAIGVDEAIAWAKEKFQTHCRENERSYQEHKKEKRNEGQKQGWGSTQELEDDLNGQDSTQQQDKWPAVETEQLESKLELRILDEKIRLWATGKETDIRLLLSTLHHIMWPNSGWFAIPLANLIESSQVKKAYQKAQLCLHPDKLQQRGISFPHKYIAEKAFSVLQNTRRKV
ncbi:Chaperone DnaJ-domain superfamily protein [Forsythia ovata]|uniref:Chaperone DnaJ-domain superfamily protein n=1 Tax=Forsythia ovata TaxID=205694 RepID=A0ABD1S147_9LAMI